MHFWITRVDDKRGLAVQRVLKDVLVGVSNTEYQQVGRV